MIKHIMDLIRAIMRHNIGSLAAVIAFFGFSSLIPVIALLVFVTSWLVPEPVVERFIQGIFQNYVPAIPKEGLFAVNTVKRMMTLREVTGMIGLASLLWSTIGGFVTLQMVLDTIYEIHKRRSFILQYVIGFAMMGILLALTIASSLLAVASPEFVATLTDANANAGLFVVRSAGRIAFPVILFITCYFIYRVLPSRALRNIPLLTGATLATIFIYISRGLFAIYTHHLRNYEIMYGTFTFVMLFTFWIYIVCIILLFAAELSVAMEQWLYPDSPDSPTAPDSAK